MSDTFINEMMSNYDAESLVTLWEITPMELLNMVVEVYPEKLDEHLHKFNGENDVE